MPLSGESSPNVRITVLPSTPSRSLLPPARRGRRGCRAESGRSCRPGCRGRRASRSAPCSLITTSRSDELASSSMTRALRRIRLGEDGVQRRDDRHAQLAQQREHVAAGLAAEDAVLVLHATRTSTLLTLRKSAARRYDVEVALGDLEAHARRIRVPLAGVVHRQHEAVDARELRRRAPRSDGW